VASAAGVGRRLGVGVGVGRRPGIHSVACVALAGDAIEALLPVGSGAD
jgi:hypothetical protein